MKTLTCALAAAFALAAGPAAAQSTPRFYIAINAGAQPPSADLSDRFTFEENVEEATVDVRYPSKTGVLFDGGGGFRLWKQIGIGAAVSYVSGTGAAEIAASIPHPFVFGRPRTIEGSESGVARSETAGHVQLLYFLPTSGKIRAVLSAGPSFVSLEQEVVTEVHHSESYPYDTAAFSRATTNKAKGSATGFNVGADVAWMLGRSFGVGGMVRFTRATIDLDAAGSRTLSVDTGGVQAAAGVRLHF